MDKKPTWKAWLGLVLLSLVWGSSFILIKKGLLELSAEQVGALRMVAASTFVTPIAIARLKRVKKKHIWPLISVGFTGSLLPSFLFSIAQTKIDSSTAGVMNALTPLWVIILGALMFRIPVKFRTTFGLLIGFLGTAVLVLGGAGGSIVVNLYALFVVAATVCYGFNLNVNKYRLPDLDALTITSVSIGMVGPVALVYLFSIARIQDTFTYETPMLVSIASVVFLGIVGTALALLMFNKLVQATSTVFTSSVTYLIPIVAIFWGVWDGERISTYQYLGMALILLGVYIANRSRG
jgi:drug/metabolite transporter (DMT)-like permease